MNTSPADVEDPSMTLTSTEAGLRLLHHETWTDSLRRRTKCSCLPQRGQGGVRPALLKVYNYRFGSEDLYLNLATMNNELFNVSVATNRAVAVRKVLTCATRSD